MNRVGAGMRLMVFARSVLMLTLVAIGLPLALLFAARERFGASSPFAGVVPPSEWSIDRIWGALTDRLTDQTIADVVIRLSLVVAWVAVIAIVLTVAAEVAHMLRHDGLAMPDVRGFGMSQRTARIIASGLLVIIPLFTSPASAIAKTGSTLVPEQRATATVEASTFDVAGNVSKSTVSAETSPGVGMADDSVAPSATPQADGEYVVRAGDSVFGIAERLAGPEQPTIDAYAERLIELNLGRQMPDGRQFNNAAFLDVGWVLELPSTAADSSTSDASLPADAGPYVVEAGDSLWSIADDELGDPLRWPEVFEANEGRTFDDGRVLSDPDLIHPGWDISLPGDEAAAAVDDVVEPVADTTVDVEIDAEIIHVEPHAEVESPPMADSTAGETAGLFESPGGASSAETAVARQDNVWGDDVATDAVESPELADPIDVPAPATAASTLNAGVDSVESDETPVDDERESEAPELLTLGRAAMLSAGILTLLAVRRRNQLRRARPRSRLPEPPPGPAGTERALRSIDSGERFSRVDIASRAIALSLIERDQRLLAVLVAADGTLEVRTSGSVELAAPWEGTGSTWHLAASTPLEMLAQDARQVGAPCPTLVQIGSDEAGRDVYIDLEALEALEVGGPGGHADAIVAAVAATLAASVLAEVTTLIGLGVPDDAFLGHRHYVPVRNGQQAFEEAGDAIGSTASMTRSTFDLRARGTSGETWEPAVVLAGSAAGTVTPPQKRTGLAVVSASPIHGPSSRLAPDGDAWLLLPLDIRLTPVGLTGDDIAAIADLVAVVEPLPAAAPAPARAPALEAEEIVALDGDHTIVGSVEADGSRTELDDGRNDETAEPLVSPVGPPPQYALLVHLLGAVDVVDHEGGAVQFERSKTRELVAWLATHRDLSTRAAARTALWELDVRDATFANVVSEARRSLARLVEPPEGEEWVGRTNTEALPLHPLVRTDVDLVRHALDTARVQPPAQAIATLEPAVDLITGMPFAGTAYLWPDSEGITSNLVLLATTATTELAAHCLSVGDIEGVFDATSRGLQVLPGHEELIGLRMQAHARAGDHAGVRQEWETYERVINGDPWSDGEPAPKLVDLRQQLLNPSR